MSKVLFLNDGNGFDAHNPSATLVDIPENISIYQLKKLESGQLGVRRRGGSWKEIMEDGKIEYTVLSSGKKSNFKETDYDIEYNLISGNY